MHNSSGHGQGRKRRQIIQIMIETPSTEIPAPVSTPDNSVNHKQSVEDVIRDAIEMIESGYDSEYEWELLRSMNNRLLGKQRLNNREIELLCMMEPTISRYRQFDHREVKQDPARMSELRAQLSARSAIDKSKSTDSNRGNK